MNSTPMIISIGPSLVAATATIIASFLAIAFAFYNTRYQIRKNNEMRDRSVERDGAIAALKMIMEFDERTLPLQDAFSRVCQNAELVAGVDIIDTDDPNLNNVRELLNIYESLAIGVERGLIDEELLKDFWRTMLVRTYLRSKKIICTTRKAHDIPTAFINFERLALRWEIDADRVWLQQKFPLLVEDEL